MTPESQLTVKPGLSLAALLLLVASCSPDQPPELRLSDAWARETVSGQTATAAYLTIANRGGSADTLVAVGAPVPARASLHRTRRDDGIARMRPIEGGLEIPPGESVRLEPGGPHIMIENLAGPLGAGETLRLTLRFTRTGERAVDMPVAVAGATGPAHQGH
jgi:copper(I)-binding protein